MATKTDRLLFVVLILMSTVSCSGSKDGQKREYTGTNVSHYQREALIKLDDFYTHMLEATAQPDVTDTYITGMDKEISLPGSVFIPDFTMKGNDTGETTLKSYAAMFYDTYQKELEVYLNKPNYLTIQIEDADYDKLYFSQDGNGIEVPVSYQVSVIADGNVLYQGRTQSIVVFPDFMSVFKYQISQIAPVRRKALPKNTSQDVDISTSQENSLAASEPQENNQYIGKINKELSNPVNMTILVIASTIVMFILTVIWYYVRKVKLLKKFLEFPAFGIILYMSLFVHSELMSNYLVVDIILIILGILLAAYSFDYEEIDDSTARGKIKFIWHYYLSILGIFFAMGLGILLFGLIGWIFS